MPWRLWNPRHSETPGFSPLLALLGVLESWRLPLLSETPELPVAEATPVGERTARPPGKEEREGSAEHKGTLLPLEWKVDSAGNRMMRKAVTCAFAFWPPLRSSPRSPSVGRALPRAGVLNAESRRNAEVPRDASRHAAGRADHANRTCSPARDANLPREA